jgi:hypothetical protein
MHLRYKGTVCARPRHSCARTRRGYVLPRPIVSTLDAVVPVLGMAVTALDVAVPQARSSHLAWSHQCPYSLGHSYGSH